LRVVSRVAAAYFACVAIWGTTWYAIRACIGAGGYPTYAGVALRFAIAAAVLLPIAARLRPWPRGAQWGYLALAGTLDACGYLLVYLGEERVPGAVGAVVFGTMPLVLAVLLAATRVERITARHVAGSMISLGGVIVLGLDRLDVASDQAIGVVLIFGSVVVSALYSIIMKQHGGAVHGVVATAVFLAVTAIVLGAVAIAAGEPPPWPPPLGPTIALVYLAVIGSVVAFLTYFWLLGVTSLQLTSTLVLAYPLVALVVDAAFEREVTLGPRAYVGVAITLGGLAVSLRRSP
jgi:drug/metabolite transporter (DMT)-like permease